MNLGNSVEFSSIFCWSIFPTVVLSISISDEWIDFSTVMLSTSICEEWINLSMVILFISISDECSDFPTVMVSVSISEEWKLEIEFEFPFLNINDFFSVVLDLTWLLGWEISKNKGLVFSLLFSSFLNKKYESRISPSLFWTPSALSWCLILNNLDVTSTVALKLLKISPLILHKDLMFHNVLGPHSTYVCFLHGIIFQPNQIQEIKNSCSRFWILLFSIHFSLLSESRVSPFTDPFLRWIMFVNQWPAEWLHTKEGMM